MGDAAMSQWTALSMLRRAIRKRGRSFYVMAVWR